MRFAHAPHRDQHPAQATNSRQAVSKRKRGKERTGVLASALCESSRWKRTSSGSACRSACGRSATTVPALLVPFEAPFAEAEPVAEAKANAAGADLRFDCFQSFISCGARQTVSMTTRPSTKNGIWERAGHCVSKSSEDCANSHRSGRQSFRPQ